MTPEERADKIDAQYVRAVPPCTDLVKIIAQAIRDAVAEAVEREREALRQAVEEIPLETWSDELIDEMAALLKKMSPHGLIGYVRERTLQETFAGLDSVWLDRPKP